MVNLTALQNITPLDLNTSIIQNADTIIPNLIMNTNTQTDNWWGLLIMLSLFFYLIWKLSNDAGRFRLDFIKSLLYSSGMTIIVGGVMIATNITTTYNHVIWFGIIFTLAAISAWFLKQKGLYSLFFIFFRSIYQNLF